MLDFGDTIILFEFKHFMLPHDVKYGRSGKKLEQELRKKLFANQRGKQKAIRQLATSVRAIRSGRIPTLSGKEGSSVRVAPIYPVVVVSDLSLEAPFVNTFCNELFQPEISGLAGVRPLTLMSVQELENTLPVVTSGDLTWRELFEARFNGTDLHPTSINQARYNLARQKGLTYRRNQYRLDQFERIFKQLGDLYTGQGAATDNASPDAL
jgi:hypothetical protein